MSDTREPSAGPSDRSGETSRPESRRPAASAREQRLAAALRANLARRKSQKRTRAADDTDDTQET